MPFGNRSLLCCSVIVMPSEQDRRERLAVPFLLCAQRMWHCGPSGTKGEAAKFAKTVAVFVNYLVSLSIPNLENEDIVR